MKVRVLLIVAIVLGLFLFLGGTCFADGIIIVEPPPGVPITRIPRLSIRYHHVTVEIEDQVATTHIDQVFVNESGYELEGTFIFPLPEEASIQSFSMYVDGEKLEGEILEREKARQIYESIVRRRKDPALLEYVGRNAFRARVYPIPPHGEKRVELTYSQVLPLEQGLVKYIYPLDTERFSAKPLEEVVINVAIRSHQALKAVYSPSHDVAVERPDDYTAEVSFEEREVKPDRDFGLYYSLSEEDFGLNLLSYRTGQDAGFFLLLVAPKVEIEEEEVVAKDVVFVLDTSGSMRGKKLAQAKKALEFILQNLNEEDRFNIIAFSTATHSYAPELVPASEGAEAKHFVEKLRAVGSTNINRALLEGLAMAEDERPCIVIFLTDGLPTAGVKDPGRILENVGQAAKESARIFAFGVGDDVNTYLLDHIAQEHRGTTSYVRPRESIEEEVSAFYAKITTPLLTDMSLGFGRIRVRDTYPEPLPDLFLGGQLVMVGRYEGSGPTTITLEGEVDGEKQRFTYEEVTFRGKGGEGFIPRLWASRKIGYLLAQIEAHSENRELIEEIVELSTRYGIMTPYTSFLVEEPRDILSSRGRRDVVKEVEKVVEKVLQTPPVGAKAVERSVAQEALRQSERVSSEVRQIAHVGEKTFILQEGVWTDTTYDRDKMETTKIGFGSHEYFRIIAEQPDWGRYFALGTRVILVAEGKAYEVAEGEFPPVELPSAKDTPTPPETVQTSPTIATPAPPPSSQPAPRLDLWGQILSWLRRLLSIFR